MTHHTKAKLLIHNLAFFIHFWEGWTLGSSNCFIPMDIDLDIHIIYIHKKVQKELKIHLPCKNNWSQMGRFHSQSQSACNQ